LKQKTVRNDENLVPHLIECAKAYITLQEVCDVFRDVFGEYDAPSIL
jgi:methylmalonyl-CoA mutase N-terminal domain/subunit